VKNGFPSLPTYVFSWRSVQIELIPGSGERLTVGSIVNGEDNALIAARLIPLAIMRGMYGDEYGSRLADVLRICMDSAEKYYSDKPISNEWRPVLEGFFPGNLNSSFAEDIEHALLIAKMHSSALSVALDLARLASRVDETNL